MNMHNRRSFYIYKEFRELQQETQKQWTVREKAISEREKQFQELKTKV
jgi:predicted RNA-binding protein YlxR (DUF448 family)